MKVYVVTRLSSSYDEIFLCVKKNKPQAVKYLQEKYPYIGRMDEKSSSHNKTVYKAVFPPGATGEWIQSVTYLFINEIDI